MIGSVPPARKSAVPTVARSERVAAPVVQLSVGNPLIVGPLICGGSETLLYVRRVASIVPEMPAEGVPCQTIEPFEPFAGVGYARRLPFVAKRSDVARVAR